LQCVAVCRSVSQCVAVCCSVLQCVAVCCSVLQCGILRPHECMPSQVMLCRVVAGDSVCCVELLQA